MPRGPVGAGGRTAVNSETLAWTLVGFLALLWATEARSRRRGWAWAGRWKALCERHEEINKALQTPAVSDAIKTLGAEPAVMSREQFVATQLKERDRFGAIVKEIGLKLE